MEARIRNRVFEGAPHYSILPLALDGPRTEKIFTRKFSYPEEITISYSGWYFAKEL
ncbi:MAG: hypothetical protein RL641_821 [Candidatus Parcubacteria bacterium]|jgi:hypothetical protein